MERAERLVPHLEPGMLMLADRYYGGFPLWSQAQDRGADLPWRVKSNQAFPVRGSFPDGSWSSVINGSGRDRPRLRGHRAVRVVRYRMPGSDEAFTLITTLLDPEQAPAAELAALYHERREIETAYDEVRTHMPGPGALLRSRTPELALQELDGLVLAHYAARCLIHEAAASAGQIILPPCRQRRAPPDRSSRRFSPHGRRSRMLRTHSSTRSSKNRWSPVGDRPSHGASSARWATTPFPSALPCLARSTDGSPNSVRFLLETTILGPNARHHVSRPGRCNPRSVFRPAHCLPGSSLRPAVVTMPRSRHRHCRWRR